MIYRRKDLCWISDHNGKKAGQRLTVREKTLMARIKRLIHKGIIGYVEDHKKLVEDYEKSLQKVNPVIDEELKATPLSEKEIESVLIKETKEEEPESEPETEEETKEEAAEEEPQAEEELPKPAPKKSKKKKKTK